MNYRDSYSRTQHLVRYTHTEQTDVTLEMVKQFGRADGMQGGMRNALIFALTFLLFNRTLRGDKLLDVSFIGIAVETAMKTIGDT